MKKFLSLFLSCVIVMAQFIPLTEAASSQRKKRVIHNGEPAIIYVYQTIPNTISPNRTLGYPGCGREDIVIGGQVWAACNATTRNYGSRSRSGWFFANDLSPSFISDNNSSASLEWKGKVTPVPNWGDGPCAEGYRLPSRGDWETLMFYARQNGTSASNLINLPRNGGFRGYKDTSGDVRIEGRNDVAGSYWTSTYSYNGGYFPMMMKLGNVYQNVRMDGTYYGYNNYGYNWQYTDTGLELIGGTSTDLANVRCIRK